MSSTSEVSFTLRVMINKEKTKALFAKVDNDFADVLLSFLRLPLGTIVRLFEKHYGDDQTPVIGSLNTLYNGLKNLDDSHFWSCDGKEMLLNPRKSYQVGSKKQKLNIDDTPPTQLFECPSAECPYGNNSRIEIYHNNARCGCGESINMEILIKSNVAEDIVFTKDEMSFLINDNLGIFPNVSTSLLQCLTNMGITETGGAEEIIIVVGLNEIMDLLKGLLLSRTPLTDLILKKSEMHTSKPFILLLPMMNKGETISISKKMVVKAIIQKSTDEFLFALAEEDFVDFLFSLLAIPLGQVEKLLENETSLGSMDNLYRGISNLDTEICLISEDAKETLINPKLPPKYLSKYQLFTLYEKHLQITFPHPMKNITSENIINDPKGEGSYVKGKSTFMVKDDLTITPSRVFSSISTLNGLQIPISDVEERELHVGLAEGLNILRASLTSTCALTIGLNINPMKQPKQEY